MWRMASESNQLSPGYKPGALPLSYPYKIGGDDGNRTHGLQSAELALSQLSYIPIVGTGRIGLPITPCRGAVIPFHHAPR